VGTECVSSESLYISSFSRNVAPLTVTSGIHISSLSSSQLVVLLYSPFPSNLSGDDWSFSLCLTDGCNDIKTPCVGLSAPQFRHNLRTFCYALHKLREYLHIRTFLEGFSHRSTADDVCLLIVGDRRGSVSFGVFGDITDCCE